MTTSISIEADGERFDVSARVQPDGRRVYDFRWIDGPGGSAYGFTLGLVPSAPASPTELSRGQLERQARLFVRAFFAPDGIGPSDFPEFVASRREGHGGDPG